MKNIFSLILVTLFCILPVTVFAMENQENIINITEKYYKTTTIIIGGENSMNRSLNNNIVSKTEEITKEEYDDYNVSSSSVMSTNDSTNFTIETTYKKMTTTISQNGTYYRYKVVLNWKNMPKIRSYDVIAIGHYASVKVNSGLNFTQKYCTSINDCTYSNSFTAKITDTGSGAVFKLPTGDFVSLSQTLYFDVQKATTATVIRQEAVGDYAHAIKTVSKTNASQYDINLSGIYFNSSSISSNFDSINPSIATWTGTW